MTDSLLLFHSPCKMTESDLATVRSRNAFAKTIPWTFAAGLGGGYFAINNFVLKRHLHYQLVGLFAFAGYWAGCYYVDNVYYSKATFSGLYDGATKGEDALNSPIVNLNIKNIATKQRE